MIIDFVHGTLLLSIYFYRSIRKSKMKCPHENKVIEYLDGRLSDSTVDKLEAHFDQCPDCRELIAEMAIIGSIAQSSEDHLGGVNLETSKRYLIMGEHSQGGQARIMLAYDEQLGREIAIKELLPPPSESLKVLSRRDKRFLREARITSQLSHPSIVEIYEIGHRQDGTLYYTMQLVKGKTLSSCLSELDNYSRRIGLLDNFLGLCHAMAYAHSRGVIHRDLKPKNIMIGEFGESVLIDWGLAKVLRAVGNPDANQSKQHLKVQLSNFLNVDDENTKTGDALGTPAYMSPEQARGEVGQIDHRSDIWGLGAVLYEILTGHPPFKGDSTDQIIENVKRGNYSPVKQLVPQAADELVTIVKKALQPKKEDRYQSVSQMLEDVESYMTGKRVSVHEYSSWELFKRFTSKNKVAVFSGFSILAVIVTALVLLSLAYEKETAALEDAQFNLAQAYLEKAEQLYTKKSMLSAKLFAAAALQANPTSSKVQPALDIDVKARSLSYQIADLPLSRAQKTIDTDCRIMQLASSAKGEFMALACRNNGARIINLKNGKIVVLPGHQDEVLSVAFSADDRLLATTGRDGYVRVWDVESKKYLHQSKFHKGEVARIAFSPDGRWLVSAGEEIHVQETDSYKVVKKLTENFRGIQSLAFSKNGRLLAAGSEDGLIYIWEVKQFILIARITGHKDSIEWLFFTKDDRSLISAGFDAKVRTWEIVTRKKISEFSIFELPNAQDISADEKIVATSYLTDTIKLFDLETGDLIFKFKASDDMVSGVMFSEDNRQLITASHAGRIKFWDYMLDHKDVGLVGNHDGINSTAFSADGKLIASGSLNGQVIIWETASGKKLNEMNAGKSGVSSIYFSPLSNDLTIGTEDGHLAVWSSKDNRQLTNSSVHQSGIWGLVYTHDGRYLITASLDGHIKVWDALNEYKLVFEEDTKVMLTRIALSSDSKLLSATSMKGNVFIIDLEKKESIERHKFGEKPISMAIFMKNPRYIIFGGMFDHIAVFDRQKNKIIKKMFGHKGWVNGMKLFDDDKYLVSISNDQTLRVWSLESLQPELVLKTSREINSITMFRDLVGFDDHKTVRLYLLDHSWHKMQPQDLLNQAQQEGDIQLNGFEIKGSDFLFGLSK
jgi:WD40 repeat protein/serine/threonine protein kinase